MLKDCQEKDLLGCRWHPLILLQVLLVLMLMQLLPVMLLLQLALLLLLLLAPLLQLLLVVVVVAWDMQRQQAWPAGGLVIHAMLAPEMAPFVWAEECP